MAVEKLRAATAAGGAMSPSEGAAALLERAKQAQAQQAAARAAAPPVPVPTVDETIESSAAKALASLKQDGAAKKTGGRRKRRSKAEGETETETESES